MKKPTNKLHIGSGSNILPGWVNLDKRKGDVRADTRNLLPFKDNSFQYAFSEHFLEHLTYPDEANFFLKELRRVLSPNAVVRISVPDTEYSIKAYFEKNESYFKMCRDKWHPSYCTTMMESINYHFRQAGQHKFAYDYETIYKVLSLNGFEEISKKLYRTSSYPELRVDSRDDPGNLIVEAKNIK